MRNFPVHLAIFGKDLRIFFLLQNFQHIFFALAFTAKHMHYPPPFFFPFRRPKKRARYCSLLSSSKATWVRPHLVESTTSRPICEVKQPQAPLVLRSVMTWEPGVSYSKKKTFFCTCRLLCKHIANKTRAERPRF